MFAKKMIALVYLQRMQTEGRVDEKHGNLGTTVWAAFNAKLAVQHTLCVRGFSLQHSRVSADALFSMQALS